MLEITDHLLIKLGEECSEVSKEVSKALLFGYDDYAPSDEETNVEKIEYELNDLLGVIDMLIEAQVLNGDKVTSLSGRIQKRTKIKKWMKYSQEQKLTSSDDDVDLLFP